MSAIETKCIYSMEQDSHGMINVTCKMEKSPAINKHKYCHKTSDSDTIEQNAAKPKEEVIMIHEDLSLIQKNLLCQSFPGSCVSSTTTTPLLLPNNGSYDSRVTAAKRSPCSIVDAVKRTSSGATMGSPVFTECWRVKPSLLSSIRFTNFVREFNAYVASHFIQSWCGVYIRQLPGTLINKSTLKNLYPSMDVERFTERYRDVFEINRDNSPNSMSLDNETNSRSRSPSDHLHPSLLPSDLAGVSTSCNNNSESVNASTNVNSTSLNTTETFNNSNGNIDDGNLDCESSSVLDAYGSSHEPIIDKVEVSNFDLNCSHIASTYRPKHGINIDLLENGKNPASNDENSLPSSRSAEVVGAHGNTYGFGQNITFDSNSRTIREYERNAFRLRDDENKQGSRPNYAEFGSRREILSIMSCGQRVCLFAFDQVVDVSKYFLLDGDGDADNELADRTKISAADLRFSQCSVLRQSDRECRFLFYETFMNHNNRTVESMLMILCVKADFSAVNVNENLPYECEPHADSVFSEERPKILSDEVLLPNLTVTEHRFVVNDSIRRAILVQDEIVYVTNANGNETRSYRLDF